MRRVAIGLIKFYRFAISPMLGINCRFHPSCSAYAEEAFYTYGFFKGVYLTSRRLIKCHPFHPGGYDPVVKDKKQDVKLESATDRRESMKDTTTNCPTNHSE